MSRRVTTPWLAILILVAACGRGTTNQNAEADARDDRPGPDARDPDAAPEPGPDARPEPYAQAPTMRFGLRISDPDGGDVESIALGCQIRIEPNRLVAYDSVQPGLPDASHERHFEAEGGGFVYRLVTEYELRGGIAGLFDRILLPRAIRRAFNRTFDNLERELSPLAMGRPTR